VTGRVTHAAAEGVHVLRYFGRVDYVLAAAIKRFADDLISHEDVRGWIFDLTEAELLDSTNLGLLARLGGDVKNVIVSTSDDINSVLRSMSFDQMFDIVTDPAAAPTGEAEAISAAAPSRRELGQTMLEAHRTLMGMSEQSRLQFHEVVAALEADLAP
jgi:anti-anti-sigma factor